MAFNDESYYYEDKDDVQFDKMSISYWSKRLVGLQPCITSIPLTRAIWIEYKWGVTMFDNHKPRRTKLILFQN